MHTRYMYCIASSKHPRVLSSLASNQVWVFTLTSNFWIWSCIVNFLLNIEGVVAFIKVIAAMYMKSVSKLTVLLSQNFNVQRRLIILWCLELSWSQVENLDWNSSDIIVSSAKTGTAMAVLAIPVLSALASHHNAMILMRLVVEQTSVIMMMMWISTDQLATATQCESVQTSWLLPHAVNQYGPVGYCLTLWISRD